MATKQVFNPLTGNFDLVTVTGGPILWNTGGEPNTYTASQVLTTEDVVTRRIVYYNGGAPPNIPDNFTTPTAADLIAALPGCEQWDTFELFVGNKTGGGGAVVLVGGVGVTMVTGTSTGNNDAGLPLSDPEWGLDYVSRTFLFTITSPTTIDVT